MEEEHDPDLLVNQGRFHEFLDSVDDGYGDYSEAIKAMMDANKFRLQINLNDLRAFDEELTHNLIDNPIKYLKPLRSALMELVMHSDPDYGSYLPGGPEFHVGFHGSFGRNHVTPRGLMAHLLGKLVLVDGIVTKCSLVR